MFDRIYGPQRRQGLAGGSTVASLAIHLGALGVAVVLGGAHAATVIEQLGEGIVFLAPPPSAAAAPPEAERVTYAALPGDEGATGTEGLEDGAESELFGTRAPRGGEAGASEGVESAAVQAGSELPASDSVFMDWQVDNPVAFDAASAAPAYPDSLQAQGVEGMVIAQFVVDTTGHVEQGTFVLLESSHRRFTESVRDAIPNMLFRPAEVNGRRIKQLVQQPFIFRIEPRPAPVDTGVVGDSGAVARRGG